MAEVSDLDFLKNICWASEFAISTAIKYARHSTRFPDRLLTFGKRTYRDISDDSPPTMAATLGSLLTSLRPDRALSSRPVDPPRELFKNQ
jgi:hypothetical protein